MKIGSFNIELPKQKPQPPVINPDVARIKRELDYKNRLGKTREATKRLENRIKSQRRSSLGK